MTEPARRERPAAAATPSMSSCEYDPNAWPGWVEVISSAIILTVIIVLIMFVAG